MIKLVVFDCDGVLFESTRANIAYYNAVLAEIGRPPLTPDWERKVHFFSSSQVYDEMFGAGSRLANAARAAARNVDYRPFFELMDPMPELLGVLTRLRRRYRLAMATNRSSTIGEILRRFGLDRYIEHAVGVLDVERPKPHPDMLIHCLRHFAIDAGESVYVGDAETDRIAAQSAGMHFVAVGNASGADRRIHDIRELEAELRRPGRALDGRHSDDDGSESLGPRRH